MLTPSYSQLMEKINSDKQVDSKITSRYTIVLAVAKRARQIIDGADPLAYTHTDRAVSVAVKEMGEGKIKVHMEEDLLDGSYERMLAYQTKFAPIAAAADHNLHEGFKDNFEAPSYIKADEDDNDIEADDFKDGFVEEGPDEDEFLYDDDTDLEDDDEFEDDLDTFEEEEI